MLSSIFTNTKLVHMGVKESNLCDFCKQLVETCNHLFFDCPKVYPLWAHIEHQIKSTLSCRQVIMNNFQDNPLSYKSALILITKYYIYQSKCLAQKLNVKSLSNYMQSYIDIEQLIVKKHNKIAQHQLKWSDYV